MDIGQRVRDLRIARNITAKDLAEQIGVSPAFISALEHHSSSCSLKTLARICEVLEVSYATFFDEDKDLFVQKIEYQLQQLSKEQQLALFDFLRTLHPTNGKI